VLESTKVSQRFGDGSAIRGGRGDKGRNGRRKEVVGFGSGNRCKCVAAARCRGPSCRQCKNFNAQSTQSLDFAPEEDVSLAWKFWDQVSQPQAHRSNSGDARMITRHGARLNALKIVPAARTVDLLNGKSPGRRP